VGSEATGHLPEERPREAAAARRHRVAVGVLRLEVVEDVGARASVVAQLEVGVVARALGRFDLVRPDGGDGR
jgi:hypothetical protein